MQGVKDMVKILTIGVVSILVLMLLVTFITMGNSYKVERNVLILHDETRSGYQETSIGKCIFILLQCVFMVLIFLIITLAFIILRNKVVTFRL